MNDDSLFYNMDDIAKKFGISKTSAYNYFDPDKGYDNSLFTVIKVGNRILVPKNDFNRWYDNLKRLK